MLELREKVSRESNIASKILALIKNKIESNK
jgi:hypothetical protein